MRWPLYFVSNKIKNSLHRVSLMPLDGCRRFGAIEFERHDNHEKTIQLYPGTVRVREAFVLRSIEVYPWFNDLVTASFTKNYFLIFISVSQEVTFFCHCWRGAGCSVGAQLVLLAFRAFRAARKMFSVSHDAVEKKRGQKKKAASQGRATGVPPTCPALTGRSAA